MAAIKQIGADRPNVEKRGCEAAPAASLPPTQVTENAATSPKNWVCFVFLDPTVPARSANRPANPALVWEPSHAADRKFHTPHAKSAKIIDERASRGLL